MQNTSAIDLLQAGREHHRAGRLETAEALYRKVVELDASAVDARLNLGIVLQDLGRLEEAGQILGQLVVDYPKLAAGWVQLARAIAPLGFTWEAHGAINKALKLTPDAQTLVALSMLQLTLLQDIDAAQKTIQKAVRLSPGNAAAWIQSGQILAVKGKKHEAAKAYHKALVLEPGNALATFYLKALGTNAASNPDDGVSPTVAVAPLEYVRALFDGCAERFDELLVGALKYRTPQMLDRMFSQWQQGTGGQPIKPMTMFDAGCGTGLCGLWLARYRGRLIGVDLSRRMIAEAQARNVYDELVPGEVVEELEKRPGAIDLLVAADVMVYFGDLASLFAAATAALGTGGIFLFSVEATTNADFQLLPTQRFAHSLSYLERLASSNGLAVRVTEQAVIRLEKGSEVRGYLVLAEKYDGRDARNFKWGGQCPPYVADTCGQTVRDELN